MSRARATSRAWVVADDLDQAKEDLAREWSAETRARWVIDTATPTDRPVLARRPSVEHVLDRASLEAQRRALTAVIPPDPEQQLREVRHGLHRIAQAEHDLATGTGIWAHTEINSAVNRLLDIRHTKKDAEEHAHEHGRGRRYRRHWQAQAEALMDAEHAAEARYKELAAPIRTNLSTTRRQLDGRTEDLKRLALERDIWLAQHPEAGRRLERLDSDLRSLDGVAERSRSVNPGAEAQTEVEPPNLELDLAMDLE